MANAGGQNGDEVLLSEEDVVHLTEQVARLSDAGVLLPSGLRALGEEQPSRRVRSVLNQLADRVEGGEPLDQALESLRSQVPGHLRGIVVSGMRTGRLSQMLGHYAAYANVGSDLRKRLLLDLTYPFLCWCMAFALVGFLLGGIGYKFGEIYKDFGVPLPFITRLIVQTSQVVRTYWWVPVNLVALVAVLFVLARLALGAAERFSLIANIPFLGRVWRWTSLAEWCHLLALLVEDEVPLSEGVTLAGDGVCDADVGRASRFMGQDLEHGLSLSQAVGRAGLFPSGLERMLNWAESNRGLPEALHMAGELFESRARAQSAVVNTVSTVLTVLFILQAVGVVVVFLFVPMITLISKLSG